MTCPICEYPVEKDLKICPQCGYDKVNRLYLALTAEDEAQLRAEMQQLREAWEAGHPVCRPDTPVPELHGIKPERDMFETDNEYAARLAQRREQFENLMANTQRRPVPAGKAILQDYTIDDETPPVKGHFDVKLTLDEWLQALLNSEQHSTAKYTLSIERDQAKPLYQQGKQQPLYVSLTSQGEQARVDSFYVHSSGQVWTLDPASGLNRHEAAAEDPASGLNRHEAAAESLANGRYLAHDDGTVLDKATNLMWMRCALGQTWNKHTKCCEGDAVGMIWDEACAQKNYNFAGYRDWRVPTIKELRTLVDEKQAGAKIHPQAFPNCPADWFWSGSPVSGGTHNAWVVDFDDGYGANDNRDYGKHVRLVRERQ